MRPFYLCFLFAILVNLHVVAAGAPAHGQESATPRSEGTWRVTASVTPVYQGRADVDGGGSYRTEGVLVRLGARGPIEGRLRGGLALSYDYRDPHFTTPTVFGSAAPWEAVQRIGAAMPLSLGLADGWNV